jgi:hypothetical protein
MKRITSCTYPPQSENGRVQSNDKSRGLSILCGVPKSMRDSFLPQD